MTDNKTKDGEHHKRYLTRRKVHENVEYFNTLFHGCDRLKRRYNQILHHHFQVLDTVAEPGIYADHYT